MRMRQAPAYIPAFGSRVGAKIPGEAPAENLQPRHVNASPPELEHCIPSGLSVKDFDRVDAPAEHLQCPYHPPRSMYV
jgi:hypothetical protein